jgi:hypothetical protein
LKLASSAPTNAPQLGQRRRARGIPGDDERPADLAEYRVGHADHGRARDLRVAREEVLDLRRVDVVPAADEHLAPPAAETEVSRGVEDADVAGVDPSLRIDDGGRRVRVAPVAAHDGGRAHDDLARRVRGQRTVRVVDDAQVYARVGFPTVVARISAGSSGSDAVAIATSVDE